jgi:hypothetical protein
MKKKAIDWNKVAPMMSGGLMLGGGVGAAVALYKLMNRLNENRKKEKDTSYDDDTLYLTTTAPDPEDAKSASEKKATSPTTVLAGGLGGLLAAYVGYKGVDAIYNKVRQSRLQAELDEAQNIYLDRLQQGKQASMEKEALGSNLDRMGAGAMAVPLLVALGSALITNRVMSKANPKIKKPGKNNLRKIVLKSPEKKTVKEEKKVEEPKQEPAQEERPDGITEEDLQNLMQLSMAKSSSIRDLVCAHATDGFDNILDNFKEYGLFTTMDLNKGASSDDITFEQKSKSIEALSKQAAMQDSLALYCASEFFDISPTLCKNASLLEDGDAEALVDFSREFYSDCTKNKHSKSAAAAAIALSLLQQPDVNESDSEGLQIGNSQDSESKKRPDEDSENTVDGVHLDATDEEAQQFLEKYKDVIDAALDVK